MYWPPIFGGMGDGLLLVTTYEMDPLMVILGDFGTSQHSLLDPHFPMLTRLIQSDLAVGFWYYSAPLNPGLDS